MALPLPIAASPGHGTSLGSAGQFLAGWPGPAIGCFAGRIDQPYMSNGWGEVSRMDDQTEIGQLGALREFYGEPMPSSLVKEVPHLTEPYAAPIRASPFVILSTAGQDGLDASPRGGPPGFVRIQDSKTLILPDRSGNNRVDSLSNLVGDPRIAMIFLVPGVSECMRVNGHARISVDQGLLQSFADTNGRLPPVAIIISIDTCYAQCSQAITRAKLWDLDARVDRTTLPSFGKMLQACRAEFDGAAFDTQMAALGAPED